MKDKHISKLYLTNYIHKNNIHKNKSNIPLTSKNKKFNLFNINSNSQLIDNNIKLEKNISYSDNKSYNQIFNHFFSENKYKDNDKTLSIKINNKNKYIKNNLLNNKKSFINNFTNLLLIKLYKDKSYNNILTKRLNPYSHKEEQTLNLDLRKKISNNSVKNKKKYIIKYNNDKSINIDLSNKKYINIKRIKSKENKSDKNIILKRKNNNTERLTRYKSCIIKNNKNNYQFNEYDLKNKNFLKNYNLYYKNCKKYEKLKLILNKQNNINKKILEKLKKEQNMSNLYLKIGLVNLEGYNAKKKKKLNNNSYNLFL